MTTRRLHASHPTLRWRYGRLRSERGSTSIEMVILMPVLFTVLFLGIQAAMYYYAGAIALAAAQDGARAAAGTDNTTDPDTGRRVATAILAGSDGSLENWAAISTVTPDSVTVTVTGSSLSVIPGWHPTVTKQATAPLERLS